MVDFFERQDQAKKKTSQLVLLFILSIIVIIFAVYWGIKIFLKQANIELGTEGWFDPRLFSFVALGVLFVVSSGSLWRIWTVSRNGGRGVAEALGGRPANLHTADLQEKKLINVVEEMAIASGIPVPEIYVLEQEKAINAFAAGNTIQDAVVGVTDGCMRTLTRDELQGVIAHEFSHILNGDMRLNIRLMGLLHGILLIGIIGYYILRFTSSSSSRRSSSSSSKDKKGGNPLAFLGLALLVIGYIGVFFAKLIKAAVSRQREFLADAAAVQFTRNPLGIAGALKKIGGSVSGARLKSSNAEESSHLFFGNGVGQQWVQWLSTHPPLDQRIKVLDGSWDGQFIKPMIVTEEEVLTRETVTPVAKVVTDSLPVEQLVSHVGSPQSQHIQYATAFREALPPEVYTMLHETSGACALVFALLLAKEIELRQHQIQLITDSANPAVSAELKRLAPHALQLESTVKLPLIELAIPALRLLSPKQYQDFKMLCKRLIESDAHLDIFEFVLQKMIRKHLAPVFEPRSKPKRIHSRSVQQRDTRLLLSVLARVGAKDDAVANQSFIKGAALLKLNEDLLPVSECQLEGLDMGLDRLSTISPKEKERLLPACVEVIAADGVVKVEEGELMRAVADMLGCAIPPLLKEENRAGEI